MKIRNFAKRLLYWSAGLLFVSGLAYAVLSRWLHLKDEFGIGEPLSSVWTLRFHAVAGFAFIGVFGYIYAKHVEPSLRQNRSRKSGRTVLWSFFVLFATVPFLYYLGDETWRAWMGTFHTYLGLALLAPFILHAFIVKGVRPPKS